MQTSQRSETLRFGAFLAFAAVYKLVYLVEYARLPFLKAPIYDAVVYLRQARAVLDGRFDDAALLAFSPLYGYLLALCGAADRYGHVILIQMALGLCNLALVYHFVRSRTRESSDAAALGAMGLYLGYGLLLSYESKIVSETVALTLALLTVQVYQSAGFAAGRWGAGVGAGALMALSVLQRASLIFVPPVAVLIAVLPFRRGEALRPRLRRAAALALGLGVVFGGNGLWNRAHSGFFVPVIMVSQTVQKTTAPEFGDDFAAFTKKGQGGGTSDGGEAPNAFDVVNQAEARLAARRAGRPDPAAAPAGGGAFGVNVVGLLRGMPLKLAHALNDYEVTYDYGYFGERSEVAVLGLLPVSFGTLLILGLCGAVALAARRCDVRALLPYAPYALGSLATTLVFHASSRYRLFLVIPLILLGGGGLVALSQVLRRAAALHENSPRRLPLALLAALLLCGCAGLSARTLRYRMASPCTWELRVAQAAAVAGDRAEFERRVSRALALAPRSPVTGDIDPAVTARVRFLGGAMR